MTTQEKIRILAKGKAPSWQRKLELMPEYQVAAIYNRQLAKGDLNVR